MQPSCWIKVHKHDVIATPQNGHHCLFMGNRKPNSWTAPLSFGDVVRNVVLMTIAVVAAVA